MNTNETHVEISTELLDELVRSAAHSKLQHLQFDIGRTESCTLVELIEQEKSQSPDRYLQTPDGRAIVPVSTLETLLDLAADGTSDQAGSGEWDRVDFFIDTAILAGVFGVTAAQIRKWMGLDRPTRVTGTTWRFRKSRVDLLERLMSIVRRFVQNGTVLHLEGFAR